MRERGYVQMARLIGLERAARSSSREMMPNLLPYLAASFVGAVAHAPFWPRSAWRRSGWGRQKADAGHDDLLGDLYNAARARLWWWWLPPIVIIVMLFVGLFLVTAGLDELANPRLRQIGMNADVLGSTTLASPTTTRRPGPGGRRRQLSLRRAASASVWSANPAPASPRWRWP